MPALRQAVRQRLAGVRQHRTTNTQRSIRAFHVGNVYRPELKKLSCAQNDYERADNRDAAFEQAREIWGRNGCEYVFVHQGNGEQISVKPPASRVWKPSQPDRRRNPR